MTPPLPTDHHHDIDLEVALDFINTLDLDDGVLVEHFPKPADAAAWFIDHDLVHASAVRRWGQAELARVRAVRDALRDVVDSLVEDRRPQPASVALVNETLEARRPARLELDGSAIHVGHRHADSPVDDALALVADSIVAELAAGRPDRIRVCANDRCRWAFHDTSPTGRRRWCDMKTCGNRAKAARHRQRQKANATGPVTGA